MLISRETERRFPADAHADGDVRYGSLFAFKYSPRPGTPSLRLPNAVSDEVATERIHRVFTLQERIERDVLRNFVGKTIPVLLEGPSRHDAGMLSGRTDDNWTVNFLGRGKLQAGMLVNVRINQAQHHSLRGEVAACPTSFP